MSAADTILADETLKGASEVLRTPHFGAANAVGAAIGQISGEIDRVISIEKAVRDDVLIQIKHEAIEMAVNAGARRDSVKVVEVDETPLAYLPGNATRFRVKGGWRFGLMSAWILD